MRTLNVVLVTSLIRYVAARVFSLYETDATTTGSVYTRWSTTVFHLWFKIVVPISANDCPAAIHVPLLVPGLYPRQMGVANGHTKALGMTPT